MLSRTLIDFLVYAGVMRCHVILPYAWEECADSLSCVKAVHAEEDVNVLNSCPQQWLENLHGFVVDMFDDEDGEAMLTCVDSKGMRHNEDGPAVEFQDETRFWYQHGKLHREDGPAMEWADGGRDWYKKGVRHNADGSIAVDLFSGGGRRFLMRHHTVRR